MKLLACFMHIMQQNMHKTVEKCEEIK